MGRRFAPDIAEWGPEDEDEFFRLLGQKLATRGPDGFHPTLHEAVWAVAEDIAAVGEADPVTLSDDIFNDLLSDGLHSRLAGNLIWMWWSRSRAGGAGGLATLDLGTGKLFVVEPPDPDTGAGWQIGSMIDPEDTEALRQEVVQFVEDRGWLPHSLRVAGFVARQDLHAAYTRALDHPGVDGDWESLQMELESIGLRMPIDTPEERARALDAYLDEALE